jgi:hypothetical protein
MLPVSSSLLLPDDPEHPAINARQMIRKRARFVRLNIFFKILPPAWSWCFDWLLLRG